ncbi:hypothetical protein B484DRAFT_116959 [Ochromonadaceae sp. CCMP2298]|nr:hypothetical protein B484DRAFT_116959 [Ochromonadaceae sp. CCMP2298]
MASTSIDHSRRIRQTKGWVAVSLLVIPYSPTVFCSLHLFVSSSLGLLIFYSLSPIDIHPITPPSNTPNPNTPIISQHRSIFTMDKPTSLTSSLLIETTGPPKRCKYRLKGKENERDFSTWMPQETLDVFIGADRIPGASNFYSDFRDLPDR